MWTRKRRRKKERKREEGRRRKKEAFPEKNHKVCHVLTLSPLIRSSTCEEKNFITREVEDGETSEREKGSTRVFLCPQTHVRQPALTGPHGQRHKDTRCPSLTFSMHPCVGQGGECVLTQGHAPCTCLSHTEVHAHANENVDVHSPKEASFVLGVEESKMKRT